MRLASLGRLVVAGVLASALASSAQAQPFSYSTLGTFTGSSCALVGCGGIGWNGGIYVGYDEQMPVGGNAPATVSLGFFDADGFSFFGSPTLATTGNFYLTVVQYQPTVGMGTFQGAFGGTLSLNNSNLIWTPDQTVMTIGAMRYELTQSSYMLSAPNNQQGKLQVFANVSTTVTPEPGTIALLGTGLLALGGFGLKRRRQHVA